MSGCGTAAALEDLHMRRLSFLALSLGLVALAPHQAHAAERQYPAGSLIIPMDLAYQSQGMYQAYGLLFQLLRHNVQVDWVIDPAKTWHAARCDSAGDPCPWDCAEEGSGVKCSYPTASPDFYMAAKVVWDDRGAAAPGTVITRHGYRGGPFVIDAAHRASALAVINAWNDQSLWPDNPWASRSVFRVVTVHETTAAFTGYVKKRLLAAPTIAVFADGNEDIATSYLRAAGIKQSSGAEFPSAKCGASNCGPGTANPDMLTVPSVMGDMGTCDQPNSDHKNGALFTDDGLPAYCQIMSMHWDVADRERVQCGGNNCPATPEQCAGVPITYHGHEVVAEVRSFLQYPTHFFAECQAVNAYENTVPNPAWPYLDDEGRMGHFLTTTGTPPPCPCNPGPGEGTFECVTNGCGQGQDCCLPKDVKEKGAGFLIASSPSPFKILRPDVPYMQFDGLFAPQGGSEPAYNLSTYLNTQYKNEREVTFITAADGPGKQDVWMTGYLDGECDINEGPVVLSVPEPLAAEESCGGKVSYLGGHSYSGNIGQRLFLNALFEADCVTAAGQPSFAVSLDGPLIVGAQSLPVERDYTAQYVNSGLGAALDGVLRELVPDAGIEVTAAGGGMLVAEGATWNLGSISGDPALAGDPPASGSRTSTLRFTEFGEYAVTVELDYRVGLSTFQVSRTYPIRVLLDSDGDGVPDESDPYPNDPSRCGDSDQDGCDDCASGTFDPDNDGCAGGDGGPGNPADGDSGCGCRVGTAGDAALLGLAFLVATLVLRRRRRA
jgi:MYXO-CTERM domain-containing protein